MENLKFQTLGWVLIIETDVSMVPASITDLESFIVDGCFCGMSPAAVDIIIDYVDVRAVFSMIPLKGGGFVNEVNLQGFRYKNLTTIELQLGPECKFDFLGDVIRSKYGDTLTQLELSEVFRTDKELDKNGVSKNGYAFNSYDNKRKHFIARLLHVEKFVELLPKLQVLKLSIPNSLMCFIDMIDLKEFSSVGDPVKGENQAKVTFRRRDKSTASVPYASASSAAFTHAALASRADRSAASGSSRF